MYSKLREHFGLAGLVVGVIALVAALTGGAIAASGGGSSDQATASAKKGKQGPRGPRGPKGATGAAGPAGPTGPAGANGKDGSGGSKGDQGATGATGATGAAGPAGATGPVGPAGKGVVVNEFTGAEGPCTDGGVSIEVEGSGIKKYVCGSSGDGGGLPPTLPPGASQTGAWDLIGNAQPEGEAAFGWSIPLTPADAADITVHFTDEDGDATCTGTINQPTAPAGTLCMYESSESNLGEAPEVYTPDFAANGVGTGGAFLYHGGTASTQFALGTFAITAPL